jgi:hypothetical protein
MIVGIRCLNNFVFPIPHPSSLSLLSLHPNLDHPLARLLSCQAALCLHAPYREGAGSHIASLSLWLGKVVRPLGLGWQEQLSSKHDEPRERERERASKLRKTGPG